MIQDRPCNTRGRGATLRRFRNNQFPGGLWKRCISASIAERLAFAGLDALYLVTDDQLDARRRLGISEADPDVARVQRGPGTVTVVGLAGPHAVDVLYRAGPARLGRFDAIVVDTPAEHEVERGLERVASPRWIKHRRPSRGCARRTQRRRTRPSAGARADGEVEWDAVSVGTVSQPAVIPVREAGVAATQAGPRIAPVPRAEPRRSTEEVPTALLAAILARLEMTVPSAAGVPSWLVDAVGDARTYDAPATSRKDVCARVDPVLYRRLQAMKERLGLRTTAGAWEYVLRAGLRVGERGVGNG